MAITAPEQRSDDPAALAAAVLDEEAKRQAEQESRAPAREVLPDDLLPGVGEDALSLKDVLAKGGVSTVAVLSLLNLVDEFDRAALQVLAPDIQRSLGMSDTVLGVLGALTGLLFVVGAVPLGYLADRMRRTLLVGVCSLVFAAFAVLTGAVRNVWQLAVTRVMTGFGKANTLPVHNSLLADAYPIGGRARVFAVHSLANPAGLFLGPLLVGGIAALAGGGAGWRWVFPVIGAPALVLAVLAFFLREPRRGANEQLSVVGEVVTEHAEEAPIPLAAAFQRLKNIRSFYFFLVGIGALGFALFSVPLFLNLLLERRYDLDAFDRGIVIAFTQLGSVVAAPFAGSLGDRLFRRNPVHAVLVIAAAVGAYGLILVPGLWMPNVVLLTIVVSVATASTIVAFVISNMVMAAVIPYRLRAQGFAMIGLYLFLVGAFFGALITGSLSDAHGERMALSIVVPPAALVGAALIAYGARYVRRDLSLVVEELQEEQEERARVATAGAEVPVLQVRNLDFSYGQVQVLFDVAVDVYEGEVLALLGTNGAGKSTLLRCVSGLALPDRGVVRLDGRTITYAEAEMRVAHGIVQVPGGKAVFPTLTVAENLMAGAYRHIWKPEVVEERAERVLDLFPRLEERLDQPAGTLSGGEQQMLAIAKGLLLEPRILLLDELSLGLAPVVVQEILAVVERLKAQGITMVIVEQSVNVALSMADRAVFMEKGQVRFQGPAAELLERDDLVRAVFLGGEGG
jgi:ABC-type branched-subunit amino acid transport system ATPase component/predicted MFS family arabinose efflux permease